MGATIRAADGTIIALVDVVVAPFIVSTELEYAGALNKAFRSDVPVFLETDRERVECVIEQMDVGASSIKLSLRQNGPFTPLVVRLH